MIILFWVLLGVDVFIDFRRKLHVLGVFFKATTVNFANNDCGYKATLCFFYVSRHRPRRFSEISEEKKEFILRTCTCMYAADAAAARCVNQNRKRLHHSKGALSVRSLR